MAQSVSQQLLARAGILIGLLAMWPVLVDLNTVPARLDLHTALGMKSQSLAFLTVYTIVVIT